MRDLKYDIARSFAMIWIVGIYHMSDMYHCPYILSNGLELLPGVV